MSDAATIDAAVGFDAAAVSEYRPYLLRFARQRLRDAALIEDLVQDTLLAALQAGSGFAAKASVRTWLTGILLNKIADSVRRDRRTPVVDAPPGDDGADDESAQPEPIDWHDPARLLEGRQFIDLLRGGLDDLPPLAARAFTLREIDGRSGDDVARELGLSSAQIAVLLHRSRARLRERLQRHGFAHG